MPQTLRQWEDSLRQPALCELLPVRDYLDGCIIRTNGCFVAGYEASGLNTFFHADDTRNRTKEALEALVRSLPERSMRMQVRYEVTDGHGDLTERYVKEQRIENAVLQALDRERLQLWNTRQNEGHYLRRRLHVYFIWNPDIHHESSEFEWRKTRKKGAKWSLSANKCIQRTVREHEDFLSEFESLMAGAQATLEATGMQPRRLTEQEMFLEVKRALNPLTSDTRPYKQGLAYESARAQTGRPPKGWRSPILLGQRQGNAGRHIPRYHARASRTGVSAGDQRGGHDPGSKQDHAGVQTTAFENAGGTARYPWRLQNQHRGADRTRAANSNSPGCRVQFVEGVPAQFACWLEDIPPDSQFKGVGRG